MTQPSIDSGPIVQSTASVSDKIRQLARAGYSRSQIADLLGKRYQQVRNVLVNDERRSGQRGAVVGTQPEGREKNPGMAEAARTFRPATASTHALLRLEISAEGSLVFPEVLRVTLGVENGGGVIGRINGDGTVTLLSARASLRQAQDLVRSLVPESTALADELIAERRQENGQNHG